MTKQLPTPEELRKLIYFDGTDYYFSERPLSYFDTRLACNLWNGRNSGRRIGKRADKQGYGYVSINRCFISMHRLVWAFHTGAWPKNGIDHINGNGMDNRMENLREADASINNKNAARRKDNTSGITGVSWSKQRSKWFAQIKVDSKSIALGFYDDKQEAADARKRAASLAGFHENHGR